MARFSMAYLHQNHLRTAIWNTQVGTKSKLACGDIFQDAICSV
jgi:hypothetical protein